MPKPPNLIVFNPDQWRGGVMGHLGDPAASAKKRNSTTSGAIQWS